MGQQFTSFRDNFAIRFGLRTSSWQVSELCLGAGAYSEGLDTSTLLPEYKGVGILRGATDQSPTVRTYLADGRDAEKILLAARALRERAGTLSGMAAGLEVDRDERDVLADVLKAFGERHGPAVADPRGAAGDAVPGPLGRHVGGGCQRRVPRAGRAERGREAVRSRPEGVPPRRRPEGAGEVTGQAAATRDRAGQRGVQVAAGSGKARLCWSAAVALPRPESAARYLEVIPWG